MKEIKMTLFDENYNVERFCIIKKNSQMSLFGGQTITVINVKYNKYCIVKNLIVDDNHFDEKINNIVKRYIKKNFIPYLSV